ncbi:MAG: transposase, partial [Treponema sp.]
MGRVYKNYTKDLKEQACKLVVEKNIPVRIVAEKLSVRVQLLYKWLNQYESYG